MILLEYIVEGLPEDGPGQNTLILLPRSDRCRMQAADDPGEPRGRVANCQGGARLVLALAADFPGELHADSRLGDHQAAQINIVAFVDGAPLCVWLGLMSKHIACQCSPLGRWPTRWGLHPSVATCVWPVGQGEIRI